MKDSASTLIGFDTSTAACRVAITRGDAVLAHAVEEMNKGQAERLMTLCNELLRETGLQPGDLDAIGVGTGPGNFTGIRISVAAARGMALGLNIPAIGVSAFDALRFGSVGPCICSVAARKDEVYIQRCDAEGSLQQPSLTRLPDIDASARMPLIGHGGADPVFPTAVAICHVSRGRLGRKWPSPAPLYLRPADAAPSRDAPPRVLP